MLRTPKTKSRGNSKTLVSPITKALAFKTTQATNLWIINPKKPILQTTDLEIHFGRIQIFQPILEEESLNLNLYMTIYHTLDIHRYYLTNNIHTCT